MGARLTELLADPSDAIFSLGIVDGSVFENIARTVEGRSKLPTVDPKQ